MICSIHKGSFTLIFFEKDNTIENMAVIQRKKYKIKKQHPYADSGHGKPIQQQPTPAMINAQYVNKHLSFDTASNETFNFSIPTSEPHENMVWNDEIDMYFPRKHFFNKYQLVHDLMDHIITRPIPTNKIITPQLFPICYIEGAPFEKKKEELLKDAPTEEKDTLNAENKDKHVPETKSEKKSDEDNREGEPQKNHQENESNNDCDDESLSDYDPEFETTKISFPQLSKAQCEKLDQYIQSRLSLNEPTDFMFGDMRVMKLQEIQLQKRLQIEKEICVEKPKISELYDYNMAKLKELEKHYSTHTAATVLQTDNKINEIENELKEKFNKVFKDDTKIDIFNSKAFDQLKVGISTEDYIAKFHNTQLQPSQSMQMMQNHDNIHQKQGSSMDVQAIVQETDSGLDNYKRESSNSIGDNFDFDSVGMFGDDDVVDNNFNDVFLNM